MNPRVTLRKALEDPGLLGSVLDGPSSHTWRSLLIAAMGEPLTPEELKTFTQYTGRKVSPSQGVDELWCCVGRRGGKSRAMAALAIYLAGLCDYSDKLAKGERGVVLLLAPDMKQAKVLLDYAEGTLESTPIMSYARRGALWETYKRHFGPEGDPTILVAQGTSREFNPDLPQSIVDKAMERDPAAASAEYMAQFRTDVEGFITTLKPEPRKRSYDFISSGSLAMFAAMRLASSIVRTFAVSAWALVLQA
jgi:hypothetical protein